MAFVVQDDIGSTLEANAYIEVAYFTQYHTDRNVVQVVDAAFDEVDIQAAIVIATDYLDSRYAYVGEKKASEQFRQWPRYDAENRDGDLVFGVPQVIKESCAELALVSLQSPGSLFPAVTTDSTGQAVKRSRQKLDVLETETEYFGDSPATAVKLPMFYQADWRLKRSGLLASRRGIGRG